MKKITYVLIVPVVLISCLAFARMKTNHANNQLNEHGTTKNKSVDTDTVKYSQKIKRTPEQQKEYQKTIDDYKAYQQTDDYKQKQKLSEEIYRAGLITIKIDNKDDKGFVFSWNGHNYHTRTQSGQQKQLNDILKPGEQVQIKVFSSGFNKEKPLVGIDPAFVIKNNVKVYELAEAGKIPNYAFLYEANKVRFAEGQVSQIQKYASGKWKSALFETVNGYKFNLSFKPNAPSDLNTIADGDHVRLRFVHEVKTGSKSYAIADWVSITTNIRDYGVKNPDWFFKFYQLAAKAKTFNVTDSVFHISSKIINYPDSVKPGQSFYFTVDQKLTWTKRTRPINVVSSASGKQGKKDLDLYKVHISDPDFDLTADHVRIDTGRHQLWANGNAVLKTSGGKQIFKSDSLVYNYQTKKGKANGGTYRSLPY